MDGPYFTAQLMLDFIFNNPTIIYFGRGRVESLQEELLARAKKVLIVTGRGSVKKNGIFDDVLKQIKKTSLEHVELSGIQSNPRLADVYKGIDLARDESVDFILAVGGGSVIDTAKAIAAGVYYDGDVWDLFETDAAVAKALPLGTVLTLAATGSEMNSNTVITNEEAGRKLAMSNKVIQPVFSILDPSYTFSVNRFHTAAGVADIIAHVCEYYLSPVSDTELQDTLAEALLKICIRFGPVVCDSPNDYNARANIMWASTLALNGLIGRGKMSDWTCHAIEHEISAINDISHGAGLAIILPAFMRVTSEKYGPDRLADFGKNVWGIEASKNKEETANESIQKTRDFFNKLGLPSNLNESGISPEHFNKISENTVKRRMKTDLFDQLTQQEIHKILMNSCS